MASFQDLLDRGLSTRSLSLEIAELPPNAVVSEVRASVADLRASAVLDRNFTDLVTVAQNPADLAAAFIAAKYAQTGGAAGPLGASAGAVAASVNGGFVQNFQNGAITWHPFAGTHAVTGVMRTKWNALNAERGLCGYPTTDAAPGHNPGEAGTVQHFQGASLYAHGRILDVLTPVGTTATIGTLTTARVAAVSPTLLRGGVFEVHGAIREKYLALGGEASILGYPTTDETGTPDSVGRFNHFQGGSIYWRPETGAHEVHGLIRELWAAQGFERNAALGYPVSDELIPDRRIGAVRPESRRKPIGALPADVIKLPAEAVTAGFPATAVNTVPIARAAAATSVATAAVTTATVTASPIGALRPDLLGGAVLQPVQVAGSTPAPARSQNRFSDFENGVLYWQRGATAAKALAAWPKNASGRNMTRSAAEVLTAARDFLMPKLNGIPNTTISGVTFGGTTAYVHDGAGVQNRRHRILVMLMRMTGLVPEIFQLTAEFVTVLEPRSRKVMLLLADWRLSPVNSAMDDRLHTVLDALLWTGPELIAIDDTDDGKPVAILSVKTMPSGDVNIFIEPPDQRLIISTTTVLTGVNLAVNPVN